MNTTTATAPITAPAIVLGTLEPVKFQADVACIDAVHLEVGDTMYASGFRTGYCRKVLEVRIVDGVAFVRVREGWYRWTRIYVHVL